LFLFIETDFLQLRPDIRPGNRPQATIPTQKFREALARAFP
jgi:hypothetical protein